MNHRSLVKRESEGGVPEQWDAGFIVNGYCDIINSFLYFDGFLSPFGDMTLWNTLASCIVIPYISSYPCVTNLMLWGHILSVAPETSSMEGGDRFPRDTSHDRPDPFVARCDHAAPRGV
jgi:hypothetical protein